MPYKAGGRLGSERASKLNHIDVVNSPLVNKLLEEFEHPKNDEVDSSEFKSNNIPEGEKPFSHVFAIDGSIQHINSSNEGVLRQLAFIKTAMFRLDQKKLNDLNPVAPHPLALKKIMHDSAMFHATVFPLRNIKLGDNSVYGSVRQIIFESIKDPKLENGSFSIFETLKWLAYQKWDNTPKLSPSFDCPHCGEKIDGLIYDSDKGECKKCNNEVYLTDMLGFHLEMGEESAPGSVASAYMMIHETLFLFAGIRYLWVSNQKDLFERCLFIKDGPLNLRSQYVKLIDPIRNFLDYAEKDGTNIYICGQEKTGLFVDHLDLIEKRMHNDSYFLPSNEYIRKHVQQRKAEEKYGFRTNYGNKVFIKIGNHHKMVLMIPTGKYLDSSSCDDFIGFNRIVGTIKSILSYKHENALIPIEMAHGIASLSTYPSASIFKLFAGL
ncbi:hypothetical protein WJN01_09970 [Flavobacteriaceae bacterium SZ-1-7]|uniref:hypothetical protein n=1 Tax=Tamlana sedimenti TaxID=3134126 RepID=UPI003129B25F